ncbi:MAG: hypothetical protein ABI606_09935, partial [Rhodoferax sp.]
MTSSSRVRSSDTPNGSPDLGLQARAHTGLAWLDWGEEADYANLARHATEGLRLMRASGDERDAVRTLSIAGALAVLGGDIERG